MVPTPFLRASSCTSCRLSALRLFVGSFGPARRPPALLQPRLPAATFSTLRPTLSLRSGPAIEERRETVVASETDEDGAVKSENNDAEVPWYLEVEPPKHSALVYEPPPLPDVPEGAPKVLTPLLKHVSEDLGMDDIQLLDLRRLDPPAALGSDLIMLFGTARSERHLHVSAGRLVQWLRGKGVTANADGLLGRNELKTRLRRKARKEKLLGNRGVARGGDDGISTGWVCVTMGTVGGSTTTEETIVGPDGRTAGFGSADMGSTVVIQLFTDARREELGLERLWNGILKKNLKDQEAVSDGDQALHNDPTKTATSLSQARPSHRRMFSTSARQSADALADLKEIITGNTYHPNALAAINETMTNDASSKGPLMKRLQEYVDSLPKPDALQLLTPKRDGTPASFQRIFDVVLEGLSPQQAWDAQVWLQITTQGLGIPVYGLAQIQQLVDAMQAIPIVPTQEQYLGLIQGAFAHPAPSDQAVIEQAHLAMQVVDTMYERGKKILTHEVIGSVIKAVLQGGSKVPEAERLRATFESLLLDADLPCPSEGLLLKLLDAYADAGDWDGFWKTWRIPPKFLKPRSPQMYSYVYRRFANDRHQARAIDALRWCFNEMLSERPPVEPRYEVLDALKDCIRVADPSAEKIALEVAPTNEKAEILANREFVKMLRFLGVGQG